MTSEGGQFDKRGNGKTGVIAQKKVCEIIDAARRFSPNLNVGELAAVVPVVFAAPFGVTAQTAAPAS